VAQLIQMPLWAKCDEKDKTTDYPDGAFMLSGHLELQGVTISIRAGEKLGIAIRRNKNKQNDKAPDYYGEIYAMTNRDEGSPTPQPPQGGQG
jgi:hypothetical protein